MTPCSGHRGARAAKAVCLLVAAGLALAAAPARAALALKGIVRIADANRNEKAQLMAVMDAHFRALEQLTGHKLTARYQEGGQFDTLLKTQKPDFYFGSDYGDAIQAIKAGYLPNMRFTVNGDEIVRYCVFVPKRALVTGVADLKGKRLVSSPELLTYLKLREIIGGANPVGYFGKITPLTSSSGAFVDLAAGKADAVIAGSITYHLLTIGKPKWMDDVRPLACKDAFFSPPISIAKTVPAAVRERIRQGIIASQNHPALRPVMPLLKQIKGQVKAASPADYQPFVNYVAQRTKQGWVRDFATFTAAMKP